LILGSPGQTFKELDPRELPVFRVPPDTQVFSRITPG
jgi:hypothetical protein